jgi:uncharacterized protein (TIGR02996 family)
MDRTSELIGLLHTVKAEAEDDVPRLILADWFEDQNTDRDNEHAALIRQQCATPSRLEWARGRLQRLFSPLPDALDAARNAEGFEPHPAGEPMIEARRGLLRLAIPPTVLLQADVQALQDSEAWQFVEHLELGQFQHHELDDVLSSLLLASVPSLEFPLWFRGPDGIQAFSRLADAYLPNLHSLTLSFGSLYGGRFTQILEWAGFRKLRHLGLPGHYLQAEDLQAWCDSPAQPSLRSLDLRNNHVGRDGIAALVALPAARKLEHLYLDHFLDWNEMCEPALRLLAQAPFRKTLRTLSLGGLEFQLPGALRSLFGQGKWPALETLDLLGGRTSSPGRKMTQNLVPSRLPRLRHLAMELTSLMCGGVEMLLRSGMMGQLRELHLGVTFTSGEIQMLAASPQLRQIEVLRFSSGETGLSKRDWNALADSPYFASLHRLGVDVNLTKAAARRFVESSHFPRLRMITGCWGLPTQIREILAARFEVYDRR